MLHSGGKGDHSQVMSIHNIIDVPGKTHRKLGQGNKQGITAAGGGSLDVHGRAAGGLAQAAAHVQTSLAQAFHQAAGGGAFTFTQRGGGNGGHLNIFTVRLVLETVNNL
ncbi:hypothetical protein ES703_123663 [subsurface metagenome]